MRDPEPSACPDISAGRLGAETLSRNFADAHPPLSPDQARVEAERCYFCHDAPCIEACPTGIDIPSFIRKISTDNLRGSARTILEANIFGGTCARVCPTEILCEQACVRTAQEEQPVTIGALQRTATDWLIARGEQIFTRAAATGRRIAVVGAGPAGLACAHRLALHGHEVVVFDANSRPGGLNEYGIAAYKMADDFAQREISWLLGIGGIRIEPGRVLGQDLTLAELREGFDAVFLGIGLADTRRLNIQGETLPGVEDAAAFIAKLRAASSKSDVPIGRRIVVIGGGNTAVDAAVQARRLGAEEVTLVYRRGPEQMSATKVEQDWAQTNGVTIRHWLSPQSLEGDANGVQAACFTNGERVIRIPADMVLKAVGQVFNPEPLDRSDAAAERLHQGRIAIDASGRTVFPGVYAGGDCTNGMDLTVSAVRDGRDAAETIHADLMADAAHGHLEMRKDSDHG